jgi:hypothetical protein
VPGQPGAHSETLSQGNKKKNILEYSPSPRDSVEHCHVHLGSSMAPAFLRLFCRACSSAPLVWKTLPGALLGGVQLSMQNSPCPRQAQNSVVLPQQGDVCPGWDRTFAKCHPWEFHTVPGIPSCGFGEGGPSQASTGGGDEGTTAGDSSWWSRGGGRWQGVA